jgi:hypothetical protein
MKERKRTLPYRLLTQDSLQSPQTASGVSARKTMKHDHIFRKILLPVHFLLLFSAFKVMIINERAIRGWMVV